MGLFDKLKKKKEPDYDPTNLKVTDLDYNFIFDYDMQTWQVKEVYKYDWGENNFTKEYKIDSGEKDHYMHVADDDEVIITLTNPIKIRKIDEDLMDIIIKDEKPPNKIFLEGEKYFLDSDSAGYFHDCANKNDNWEEFITWDFYNEDETKVVSITQWDEKNIDAVAGIVVKAYEISNIIPG